MGRLAKQRCAVNVVWRDTRHQPGKTSVYVRGNRPTATLKLAALY